MNAINKTTGEMYKTKFNNGREVEREGLSQFVVNGDLVLDSDQISRLNTRGWLNGKIEQPKTGNDWQKDPATQRQYDYLDILNVYLNGRKLMKGEASRIIDAVKNGEGVGQFGLEFYDGSN